MPWRTLRRARGRARRGGGSARLAARGLGALGALLLAARGAARPCAAFWRRARRALLGRARRRAPRRGARARAFAALLGRSERLPRARLGGGAARPRPRAPRRGLLGRGLLGCGAPRRRPRPRPPGAAASGGSRRLPSSGVCRLVGVSRLGSLGQPSVVYRVWSGSRPRSRATVRARARSRLARADAGGVLELAGGVLEAQAEQLAARGRDRARRARRRAGRAARLAFITAVLPQHELGLAPAACGRPGASPRGRAARARRPARTSRGRA